MYFLDMHVEKARDLCIKYGIWEEGMKKKTWWQWCVCVLVSLLLLKNKAPLTHILLFSTLALHERFRLLARSDEF